MKDFKDMYCKIIRADPCMYYCWNIYGMLIWLYWVDEFLSVGQPEVIEKYRDNMKILFDSYDVDDME